MGKLEVPLLRCFVTHYFRCGRNWALPGRKGNSKFPMLAGCFRCSDSEGRQFQVHEEPPSLKGHGLVGAEGSRVCLRTLCRPSGALLLFPLYPGLTPGEISRPPRRADFAQLHSTVCAQNHFSHTLFSPSLTTASDVQRRMRSLPCCHPDRSGRESRRAGTTERVVEGSRCLAAKIAVFGPGCPLRM